MTNPSFAGACADLTISGVPTSKLAPAGEVQLPKVSFIVRNWNYARYIGVTIDSIRAQDYPNFEAIVIDNASSDDSRDIIERHVDDDPRFLIIHSEVNLGPLGGGLLGLEHATGDFVAFIDSDDTLLSNFASAHIQVHLASRRNVAFTSSSAMETGPNGAMLNGRRTRSDTRCDETTDGLRPAEVVPRLRSIDNDTYAVLARHTRLLQPVSMKWPWSPGTSNVYRRFMLDMLTPNCDPSDLPKLATDGHYNRLAHLLGGSAVIDLPLSTYRIHGDNFAASTPSLASMGGDAGPATKFHMLRVREMVRVFVANAPDFSIQIGQKRYWNALGALFELGGLKSAADRVAWNRDDFFSSQIQHLTVSFGERKTLRRLSEIVPSDLLREGVSSLHGANFPRRIRQELMLSSARRLHARIKSAIRKSRHRRSAGSY
ncbi:glycosyltransferase family 2 protein [Kaistia terrae]|uniref:Glycosyltransferase family 2 protein n=1 Tax=Kaistia terrae TaxID=537017 RepID=A0ABW0PR56_9HYPH|nr:glycosyltransferase family A protein [Kaistia terrae]MCX5578342.1 glycosyltransferase family A protein [Kaistia terrae]